MSKAVFQTGISWKVVENKWPGIREAFRGFDPSAIVSLNPADLDAITADRRVIRNRRKIEATVENARAMLAMEGAHGSCRDFLRGLGPLPRPRADVPLTVRTPPRCIFRNLSACLLTTGSYLPIIPA